jgi:phospholipid/cholesterol/gamma-HCH transport system permease protein
MSFIEYLGAQCLAFLQYVGELASLAKEVVVSLCVAPVRWRLAFIQLLEVGYRSQLVVIVTGGFTGAVFAAQTYFQFHRLQMDTAVGAVVAVSMFRELGPVLTGLMVSGRVGAAMSAEIGTMKVTEQIDALRALGVYPIDYLVVPRVLAMMVSMPLLVCECVGLGIVSGYFVGTLMLDIPAPYYLHYMDQFTKTRDIKMALVKGFVFAILIVIISCHQGLNAKEGAEGVGRAPTEAVKRRFPVWSLGWRRSHSSRFAASTSASAAGRCCAGSISMCTPARPWWSSAAAAAARACFSSTSSDS